MIIKQLKDSETENEVEKESNTKGYILHDRFSYCFWEKENYSNYVHYHYSGAKYPLFILHISWKKGEFCVGKMAIIIGFWAFRKGLNQILVIGTI